MDRYRIITAPSILLMQYPHINYEGLKDFVDERGLSDIPKLFGETPIGRILDHVEQVKRGYEPEISSGEILVEFAGRQCYSSWTKGRDNAEYIANILETGHGSVLAHAHYTFYFAGISRSLTHELVRHAMGVDISQESQRYVDARNMCFVAPPALLSLWKGDLECSSAQRWIAMRGLELDDYMIVQDELTAMMEAEDDIKKKTLIKKRANEAARASLPNASETRGTWTFNYRSLRHIINLRGAEDADLEIRRFASNLAMICKVMSPNVFHDVEIDEGDFGVPVVSNKYPKP